MPPKNTKKQKDYAGEMLELVGVSAPISVVVNRSGELIGASYEKSWKEGTTTPVETKETNPDGSTIYEYKEDYKKKSLTKSQIKQLDDYIAENLVKE